MKTGGKQYRVKPGDLLDVEKLPAEEGSYIELGDVLAVSRDGDLTLGDPMVAEASVLAQVRSQYKDTKILVFKYKRKVRYRRKKGHRQSYTRLYITSISHAGEEIGLPEWPDKPAPVEGPIDEAVVATAVAIDEPDQKPAEAAAEVVDEAAEDDAPVAAVDQAAEDEAPVAAVDEAAEDEAAAEVVDEAAEDEAPVAVVDEAAEDEAPVAVVDEAAEESAEPEGEVPVAEVADTAEDGSPVEISDEAPEDEQREPEAPASEDEAAPEDSDEETQSRGDG